MNSKKIVMNSKKASNTASTIRAFVSDVQKPSRQKNRFSRHVSQLPAQHKLIHGEVLGRITTILGHHLLTLNNLSHGHLFLKVYFTHPFKPLIEKKKKRYYPMADPFQTDNIYY